MNYAQLQTAVLDFLARPGDPLVAPAVPLMIQLFEAEASRRLRVGAAEKRVSLTTAAGSAGIILPEDFLEARRVAWNGLTLAYVPPDTLPGMGGSPLAYTLWGDTVLWIGPLPDTVYDIELFYQAGVPPLSNSNPSNWLISKNPDCYLYGTLLAAEAYVGHDERIPLWTAAREAAFASIEQADRKARWGAPLQIRAHGIQTAGSATGGGEDSSGGQRVYVQGSAPPGAHKGDLWWDTSSDIGGGQLYIFYPPNWVAATNQPTGSSLGLVSLAPLSGGTVNIARDNPSVYISSGPLAALTVRLWSIPAVGETAQLSFRHPVTTLAVQTHSGAAIPDAPVNAYGPGAALIFRYVEPGSWTFWK